MGRSFAVSAANHPILFLSLLVATACSHLEIPFEDLVERDGIQYQADLDEPFTGIAVTFHENGEVKSRTTYRDGTRNGVIEWYWENGQLGQTGNLKDGKKEGVFEMFDENGRLIFRNTYKDGVKQPK